MERGHLQQFRMLDEFLDEPRQRFGIVRRDEKLGR